MERMLFVYSWLTVLADGRFFRFIFSSLLRITALVLSIYLIGDAIENIDYLLVSGPPLYGEGLFYPSTVQLILLLGGYAIIHLILLRAAEIRTLYDPRYALSEVVTVLTRLAVETLFVTLLCATLIVLLQITHSNTLLVPQLQLLLDPWLAGRSQLLIFIIGFGTGFAILVGGYLVSEILEMVLRLSRNSEPKQQAV